MAKKKTAVKKAKKTAGKKEKIITAAVIGWKIFKAIKK